MKTLDPVLKLLTGLIVFFAIILVGLAKFLSDDGQTFQVVGNVLSGFVGALLMRVKTDTSPSDPPPGTTLRQVTAITTPPTPTASHNESQPITPH